MPNLEQAKKELLIVAANKARFHREDYAIVLDPNDIFRLTPVSNVKEGENVVAIMPWK